MVLRNVLAFLLLLAAAFGGQSAAAEDGRLEIHVLNRLAFGPDAESLAAIHRLGVDGWINQQLYPERLPEPPDLSQRLDRLETTKLDAVELFERYGPPRPGGDPEVAKEARRRARIILREAAEARLMRALASPRQLQEVMVDFWFNHFNVFAGKGFDHLWVGEYEERAIRPHVFGRFRDLLEATARHPAMLVYLDNWQNSAPGSPGARGRRQGVNENYAREIMELHTLGVDGGYSQDDVVALAHILTGWGIAGPRRIDEMPSDDGFVFAADRHDYGDKVFLGRTIRGEGAEEVEHALDILASHPATARHVSYQLAQYFVGDQPPPALVDRLARRWMETDGDIRAVLRLLFASREFRDPSNFGSMLKTPFQFTVSAVRAAGVDVENFRPLFASLKRLGQPIYGCPTPDGYKTTRDAWLNPDSLAQRLTFATALGSGHLPLGQIVTEADEGVPPVPTEPRQPLDGDNLVKLIGSGLSSKTMAAAEAAAMPLKAAVILGSPDFMAR